MERPEVAHLRTTRQTLQAGRGRIYRCSRCEGLHFQFGHVSALFNAESFLRLANMIHYAATELGPGLVSDEQVVIPFSPTLSLLLDSKDLVDVHRLVQDGLRWLDEPGEAPGLDVVN